MTISNRRSLEQFAAWIVATGRHVPYRLFDEAERTLSGRQERSAAERQVLADKLERWRYQLLSQGAVTSDPTARDLAESLDLAANELAQRPPRAPRCVRRALGFLAEPSTHCRQPREPELTEFKASLDVDLDELIRRAADCTARYFSEPSGGRPVCSASHRSIVLYAPLYVSNFCINHCTYCAFRYPHKIQRVHLDRDEVLRQARLLGEQGLRHLLLVAGDFPKLTSLEFFAQIVKDLCDEGFSIALEIAAQSTAAYARLVEAGACGVTLYQETYDEQLYAQYHPRGGKSRFDWRLEALERAAEAGMSRLGLGVLLGLGDPAEDVLAMIQHGQYLRARFPDVALAFSLPRIHKAPDGFFSPYRVEDETFVRFYCLLRLAFPDAQLVLSTREHVDLRNRLAKICITQMSAGSCTAPGGYGADRADQDRRQQFAVADHRTPAEVAQWLRDAGLEVSWEIAAGAEAQSCSAASQFSPTDGRVKGTSTE
jgi:2-iminoacetate synthase